jgi:hypothetical protein
MPDETTAQESKEVQAAKPKKQRSPSYPALDLESTLERARTLSEVAGQHAAGVQAVTSAWGYGPKSSGGHQAIAALKKFGLAQDEGSRSNRKIRLTTLGRELLFYGDNRDSPEWQSRARKAALTPPIHVELWSEYRGQLPDDRVIKHYLLFGRTPNFNDSGADDLLKEFRRTITFARLSESGATVSENGADNDDESEEESGEIMTPPAMIEEEKKDPHDPKPSKHRTIQVTYSPTDWALVQAPFPMSEADWQRMLKVLEGMKPGLVNSDPKDDA